MKHLYIIFIVFALINYQTANADTIYSDISVDSAYTVIQTDTCNPDLVLLDVRTDNEYNTSHIENAIHKNYYDANFSSMIDALDKNKAYIVYCASGSRSTATYNMMQTMNFTEVYNMSAGINGWNSASYPVVGFVEPKICNSNLVIDFDTVTINDTKTMQDSIFNTGNDSFTILAYSITPTGVFSANIHTDTTIEENQKYVFDIEYNPTNPGNDTATLDIFIMNDTISILLIGNGKSSTGCICFNSDENFSLYPIPANNYLNIESTEFFKRIDIYNLSGQIIFSKNFWAKTTRIPVSEFPKGMYILKISNNNKYYSKKILIGK